MTDTSETAKTEPLPGGASRWLTAALAGGVVGTVVALVIAGVTAPGAWIYAGGAHHTGFSQVLTAEHMQDFADMAGIEFLHIHADTKLYDFRNEIRWNDAAWR